MNFYGCANYYTAGDCCGVAELYKIVGRLPKFLLATVAEQGKGREVWDPIANSYVNGGLTLLALRDNMHPFIYFTDHTKGHKSGKALAAYIRKNKLGTVQSTRTRFNPTGSLTLRMWTYQPNAAALVKWYKRTFK